MAGTGEAAEPPAGKSKRKLLLLGLAGSLVLLAGGGAAAWFGGLLEGMPFGAHMTDAPPGDAHDVAGDGHDGAAPAVAFVDMPDLIVNLQSEAPRQRYLKLRLSLEVEGEPAAEAVRRLMPRIMDSFQLYLRALALGDVEGAVGMQRLKEDLTARVNLAVEPIRVSSVLLKEMLVQ